MLAASKRSAYPTPIPRSFSTFRWNVYVPEPTEWTVSTTPEAGYELPLSGPSVHRTYVVQRVLARLADGRGRRMPNRPHVTRALEVIDDEADS